MSYAHHESCAWIEAKQAGVWKALRQSGIDRDIVSLLVTLTADKEDKTPRTSTDEITTLVRQVRWDELFGKETAFAERVTKAVLGPEYILLLRGRPDSTKENTAALVALFKRLVEQTYGRKVEHHTGQGIDLWSIGVERNAIGTDYHLSLLHKGNILGIVLGSRALKDVVDLLTNASAAEVGSMAMNPRFKQAIGRLPAPEEGVMFFDIRRLMDDIKGMSQAVVSKSLGPSKPKTVETKKLAARASRKVLFFLKLLDRIDIVDYRASTIRTEGQRQFTYTKTWVRPDQKDSTLVRALFNHQPFRRLDRLIPADATGFHASGAINLEQAYHLVLDFIRQEVPGGAERIARWEKWLASVPFDPEEDLFSWWSGEIVTISFPATGLQSLSNQDWVLLVRVKDTPKARRKVTAALDWIRRPRGGVRSMLLVRPIPVKAEGFREITHPAVAMFIRPVVGVAHGWLMVGSKAGVVNKCLAVATGDAPSIMQNERFRKEGLVPDQPVSSVSFKDMRNFGEEMNAMMSAVGMGGGMAAMMLAPQPGHPHQEDKAKVARIVQTLMTIVGKLGPVLKQINFYGSEASLSTFDGLVCEETFVKTYKPQPASTTAQSLPR